MSESLRNDGRIWVLRRKLEDKRHCRQEPRNRPIFLMQTATSTWNAVIRHSVTWFPVTLLHVLRKNVATHGFGCEQHRSGRILTFSELSTVWVKTWFLQRYGNLFDMYEEITDVKMAKEITNIIMMISRLSTIQWVVSG